ncbi:hypothetical protein LJJ21_004708, partial [Salmonella enterica]|nr:hypothetical protein [Salmonella enterica]
MLQRLQLLHQQYRVRQELKKVDAQLARLSELEPADAPQLVPGHRRGVVWRVSVPGQSDVFMCLPNYAGQRYFVVYVSGLAFYRAWLASGAGHYQSCPLQPDMPNDRKFKDAVSGFAQGFENPVPIADVAPSMKGGELIVHFTDGITRSLWLLAHDVEAFPVLCSDLDSASLLADKAGVADPVRVRTLERELERI